MEWRVAEAKNKLSEVLNRVNSEGPQGIRRRDEVYVVISLDEYRQLKGETETIKDWILNGPDLSDLHLERDRSPMREVGW